jgi:hypothetical protein
MRQDEEVVKECCHEIHIVGIPLLILTRRFQMDHGNNQINELVGTYSRVSIGSGSSHQKAKEEGQGVMSQDELVEPFESLDYSV